ncbi:MAG: hypothetical protein IH849_06090 [Acidobacteria bacterium]|nr:hypothetical protein [Acidobacteriota bacterium]
MAERRDFIDLDALAEVVEEGVRERTLVGGVRYYGFVDAASGSGKDAFAVGIAHRDGERDVLDVCQAWGPPFNPSGVIEEAAELFKRFRVHEARGDKYAPGFVAEGFGANGITYRPSKRTTSETYVELLPLINSRAVVLLDQPALLRELRSLEIRGVEPHLGIHDDDVKAATEALNL